MTPPDVAEVPPNSSLFSMTSVFAPCTAATTPAVRAAAPEPATRTSVSTSHCGRSGKASGPSAGSAGLLRAQPPRADSVRCHPPVERRALVDGAPDAAREHCDAPGVEFLTVH